MTTPALDIAAGVLQRRDGQVLIARRRPGTDGAGKWEFPGGKVEPGESNRAALDRELVEELGIQVRQARPLLSFSHAHTHRRVNLQMWLVTDWQGEPASCEGQPLAWTAPDGLRGYDLLAANKPIVDALRLPPQYLITPAFEGDGEAFAARLRRCVESGVRLARLRQPGLDDTAYTGLANQLTNSLAGCDVSLLLDRPLNVRGAAGMHLSFEQARQIGRPDSCDGWFGVSCHNREELLSAQDMGADFATLSPLKPTQTHPQARPLTWDGFTAGRTGIAMPVYALGGLTPADLDDAWTAGAQGIAAIRGLWPAD